MNPKYITVHCAATQNLESIGVDTIRQWHLKRGFNDTGYHYIIRTDGTVEAGRPLTKQGAHVYGHNKDNIGVCLVGGVDSKGRSVDNFTYQQRAALKAVLATLKHVYGITNDNIKGHRDWSPDLDGDGVIEKHEWLKDCPCFDVKTLLEDI